MMSNRLNGKHMASLLLAFSSLILFSGCSLPRIIVLKDPLSPEEHLNLGVVYEKEGEFDNAIKEYLKAAKKLPIAYLYLVMHIFRKMNGLKQKNITKRR